MIDRPIRIVSSQRMTVWLSKWEYTTISDNSPPQESDAVVKFVSCLLNVQDMFKSKGPLIASY